MTILQGRPTESNILVLDGSNNPVPGLIFSDFVVRYRKATDAAFGPKTLTVDNLIPVSDGWYRLLWDSAEVAVLGPLLIEVASSGGTPFPTFYKEESVVPNTLTGLADPQLCIISGNIVDIAGSAAVGAKIGFNPVTGQITTGDSFLRTTTENTVPDALGNFSIALVRNAQVRVRIDEAGINFVFTVPDQETALLKDLLPMPSP